MIAFVVGHGKSENGGYDPGACCGELQEFQIAKEIAKHASEYFNAKYSERADLINYEGNLFLTERIKKVNDSDYSFIAEIHLNAGEGTGTETYHAKGSELGKKYASQISKEISSAFSCKNRGAKTKKGKNGDYFGIIRETKAEAVLIETLFIDTPADASAISTAEGQEKCGKAIATAIAKVLKLEPATDTNTSAANQTPESFEPYKVKITANLLNVRAGAGTNYKVRQTVRKGGVYTIVARKGSWGKLKSGAGWINLNYIAKV